MALAGWAFRMERHHPSRCQTGRDHITGADIEAGPPTALRTLPDTRSPTGLFLAQEGASDPVDAPDRLFPSLNLHATAD